MKYGFLTLSLSALIALSHQSAVAATTGTLNLSGTVAVVSELTVNPNGANNSSLDILDGEANKLVGTTTETSNNLAGYQIKLSSLNGGELRNTSDNNKKTNYTISFDGGATTAPSTTPTTVKNITSLGTLTTDTSEIRISVEALATAAAGTYTDTLTLSIESN